VEKATREMNVYEDSPGLAGLLGVVYRMFGSFFVREGREETRGSCQREIANETRINNENFMQKCTKIVKHV
jgi:hypothetical protein